MQIFVAHNTMYRYTEPVHLAPHTFRLRPRTDATQRLDNYDLFITPSPSGRTECLDHDGNVTLHTWFHEATDKLQVESRFRVETFRENAFDFLLVGGEGTLPFRYPTPLDLVLAPYLADTGVAERVRRFAQGVAHGTNQDPLSFLVALARRIFESCAQVIRLEGAPWPSGQTLGSREGSCRDLAVLFCDACRVMGLAARFVSGYERSAAGPDDAHMHAWAEAYLPGGGWRGFDPSRGLAVTNSHVAVAAAFDSELASPISGTYYGDASVRMETSIEMSVDSAVLTG
jgi:transglutaminase-like putative cysteine protease